VERARSDGGKARSAPGSSREEETSYKGMEGHRAVAGTCFSHRIPGRHYFHSGSILRRKRDSRGCDFLPLSESLPFGVNPVSSAFAYISMHPGIRAKRNGAGEEVI